MKLVNKISLWFIGIVFLVTPVSMFISYNSIRKKIDSSEVMRMQEENDRVARQLRQGETPAKYTYGRPVEITTFTTPLPEKKTESVEYRFYSRELKRNECRLTVISYYHIGNLNYRISSYNYVTKSAEILSGMLNALFWKMLLIVLAVAITARILSRKIFSPFRKTMTVIHAFNIRKKEKIRLPATSTQEFKELNRFLQKMTDKAIEEYASVKEFSENASHELQTPLAVLRSKLELLSETNINGSQAALIADMQNAIDKLSRINRSLTLLTKLENQEFDTTEKVKFCRIAKDVLAAYDDWITLKNITVTSSFDSNITLHIHTTLAEMLVTNLLSNAIRHNRESGSMSIELTARKLCITNTGEAPEIPTEELFQRFKKSNQSADSIGLGLAIVKQICEVSRFAIRYHYGNGHHAITVYFDALDPEFTAVEANAAAILVPA